jgi:hypothetical protein
MSTSIPFRLSDKELLVELKRLAHSERQSTAALISHLAELDARRLYLGLGFGSLFLYCTEVLRFSEHETYNRIEAARAARRFPMVLDNLGDGALNLSTLRLLAPHLTKDNHETLVAAASGRSKRAVEELVARHYPLPPIPPSIRKLPPPRPTGAYAAVPTTASVDSAPEAPAPVAPLPPPPTRRPLVSPLAPDRYQIRFTASAQTCEKLRQAQDLLRHAVPDGDTAEIFDRALTVLLVDLARKKLAATERPGASGGSSDSSRHIPAQVKRSVWLRDGGRCAFVGQQGRRCVERGFLEFHHVKPFAAGGPATVDNIQLRCRAHNAYEADLYFGPREPSGGEGVAREPAVRWGVVERELAPGRVRAAAAPSLSPAWSRGSGGRRRTRTWESGGRSPDG